MKQITQCIFEAGGKPSDLRKYKRTERKETVHFRGSDTYDLKDPGYDDEFSYFDGSGNGYIKDKQGHVYDVIATDRAGDAGAIAGGSHDYYVTIKKANGKDDFHVHGWIAIMSKGSNTGCIADIKAGYYLEDYIAKYWSKYDDKDGKFKELAEKGDKNAKAYDDQKAEKIQNKKDEFDARYVVVPTDLSWDIIDGKFTIRYWDLTNASIKELEDKRTVWLKQNNLKSWDEETKNNPEYQKLNDAVSNGYKEFRSLIMSVLEPVLFNKLQEVFKTKDLKSLSGLAGSFVYDKKYMLGKKDYGYRVLAIDTKKKQFAVIHTGDRKVLDGSIDIQLNDAISVFKDRASEKMIELFKKVSEAWHKANGRKQGEYVKDHWEKIYNDSAGGYGWGNHSKTKGQAKEEAKKNFEQLIRDMDFNYEGYDKKNKFTYSLSLVQTYVEGDMEPDAEPIEKPLENPEPSGEKKERGKNTVMSKGANKAAYDKMKAWHEGTRKQNLSNCSDAKLKMNYKVCKELGYEKEMSQIEAEAKKRELTLESISLNEYVQFVNESQNDEE
jgi:hypothetical protein